MTIKRFVTLKRRGVLRIAGEDRVGFLQGLVSNDVTRVSPERAIYAAFLTPQGKYLHDFFIAALGDALVLDCEAERLDDLRRRLSVYRLRTKIAIEDASQQLSVAAALGDGTARSLALDGEAGSATPSADGAAFVDPRLAKAGARIIAPPEAAAAALKAAGFAPSGEADYEKHRLDCGLPDGSRDLVVEKAILLESNFEEMNGLDWDKGCYLGQELTARTKYRGLVRKRLIPVTIVGPAPETGTPVMVGDHEAGEMRSSFDGLGLALLRVERIEEAAQSGGRLRAGEATLEPRRAPWAED